MPGSPDAFTAHVEAAIAGLDPLVQQASKIDLASSERFASTLRAFSTRLSVFAKTQTKRARQDTAFKHVSGVFHPIAVYVTGDSDGCPST